MPVTQPYSILDSEDQPNSARENKNRSGLIPSALGPTKTFLLVQNNVIGAAFFRAT